MEVIAEIRRRHLVSGESISSIARDLKLSRPTVRKHLRTESEVVYLRAHQPVPKLGAFRSVLEGWLNTERQLPKAQRRTAQRLFEGLQAEGYRGAYDSVQRFVKQWKSAQTKPSIKEALEPQGSESQGFAVRKPCVTDSLSGRRLTGSRGLRRCYLAGRMNC